MAFGGSSYADTINACPAHSASGHNLRDHAVRLLDRHKRHRLCRWRREGQNKSNADYSKHMTFLHKSFSLEVAAEADFLAIGLRANNGIYTMMSVKSRP